MHSKAIYKNTKIYQKQTYHALMKGHRKCQNSGETKKPEDDHEGHRKFPNSGKTKNPDDDNRDFEFGSLTPSSQSEDMFSENSPADHLFFNGQLLPHSFPIPRTIRTISRTTSEDSSRSNSMDSRSSSSVPSSYTPRTSSFSPNKNMIMMSLDKKLESNPVTSSFKIVNTMNKSVNSVATKVKRRNKATEMVTAQLYGSSSQRWQYITPVPGATFKRERLVNRARGGGGGIRVGGGGGGRRAVERRRKKAEERRESRLMRWWMKILRAVILACRECHAMGPSRVVNDDVGMQRKIKFS